MKSRSAESRQPPELPLHSGCHFGDATRLDAGDAWIGRSIDLAQRIAGAAEAGSLLVMENVLDASEVAMYEFLPTGLHTLEGDHPPQRTLYKNTAGGVGGRHTVETLFLAGVAYIRNSKKEWGGGNRLSHAGPGDEARLRRGPQ